MGGFTVEDISPGEATAISITVRNTSQVQITATTFVPIYGNFRGEIKAINFPLTISPGESRQVQLSVKVEEYCEEGRYTIPFTLSGTNLIP